MKKRFLVECVSCGKMVVIFLETTEDRHVALCPKCQKLAYNSKQLPEREEK
jgi:endogenous inhibitor of DNA gyrase (YacG/DUF329 family)